MKAIMNHVGCYIQCGCVTQINKSVQVISGYIVHSISLRNVLQYVWRDTVSHIQVKFLVSIYAIFNTLTGCVDIIYTARHHSCLECVI